MNSSSPIPGCLEASPAPYLSVVLPCYNEAQVIRETHRRVTAVCASLDLPYEIVVVDDGSKDHSWTALMELAKEDPNLVVASQQTSQPPNSPPHHGRTARPSRPYKL